MKESADDIVKSGTYVIVERQDYQKLCKITENGIMTLGKQQYEMNGIIGMPYWTTFKVLPSPTNKKAFTLVAAPVGESIPTLQKPPTSGTDNRTIVDDGTSQKLSKEEIEGLRESGKSSNEIVESLISNSKTFAAKTEYSQSKYINKKVRKYFQFLTILRPSVDLLQEIYFKQDYAKISCLRADALAQILSYSDVKASGTYMLYDSGSMGLPAAAMLNRVGANTDGSVVHLHPGNQPQSALVQAMNYPAEQLERLLAANLYSFLRLYHQGESAIIEEIALSRSLSETKRRADVAKNSSDETNSNHDGSASTVLETQPTDGEENVSVANDTVNTLKRKLESEEREAVAAKKPKWLLETSRAVELCRDKKIEGLVVVAKEHPLSIVNALLMFLRPSRPFVIYHCYREPLQETYVALKQRRDVINLRLYSSFFRPYQISSNRTHPYILTSDLSGYILTGYLVA